MSELGANGQRSIHGNPLGVDKIEVAFAIHKIY